MAAKPAVQKKLPAPADAAPAASFERVHDRRRIRLAQELVLEIQSLRTTLQESVESYEQRMSAQISEVLRHLQGPEGEPPHAPAVKTAAAMLRAIRETEVKPRKGRAKDLVRLQELVAQLTEMLPPRT